MEVGNEPLGAGAPDTDEWARHALARLTALPDVRRVGLALAEGGGRRLLFTASDRPPAAGPEPGAGSSTGSGAGVAWCHIDAYDRVPLNAAVRAGVPVHAGLAALRLRFPDFASNQDAETAAVAAVPLRAAGQTLGAFVLFYFAEQAFSPAQVDSLCTVGEELGDGLRQAQRRDVGSNWESGEPPGTENTLVALHVVGSDLAEAGSARHFLDETLTAWGVEDDARATAALCLSELVTNALIHTHHGCQVRAVLEEDVLTVSVRDRGSGTRPVPDPDPDPLAVHGRGLQVVEALAARWGSDLSAGGTTVWFVLDL